MMCDVAHADTQTHISIALRSPFGQPVQCGCDFITANRTKISFCVCVFGSNPLLPINSKIINLAATRGEERKRKTLKMAKTKFSFLAQFFPRHINSTRAAILSLLFVFSSSLDLATSSRRSFFIRQFLPSPGQKPSHTKLNSKTWKTTFFSRSRIEFLIRMLLIKEKEAFFPFQIRLPCACVCVCECVPVHSPIFCADGRRNNLWFDLFIYLFFSFVRSFGRISEAKIHDAEQDFSSLLLFHICSAVSYSLYRYSLLLLVTPKWNKNKAQQSMDEEYLNF